jgi:hypothetical protein
MRAKVISDGEELVLTTGPEAPTFWYGERQSAVHVERISFGSLGVDVDMDDTHTFFPMHLVHWVSWDEGERPW